MEEAMQPQKEPAIPFQTVRGADGKLYRRTVCVFIANERGEFLVGVRCDRTATQCIQGGMELNESVYDAAVRESQEEMGIDLSSVAVYLGEVLPMNSDRNRGPVLPHDLNVSTSGEVVDETRREYRYRVKTWKSMGIVGQELYPVLFLTSKSVIKYVRCKPVDPDIRQEFSSVKWTRLLDIVTLGSRCKRAALQHICAWVYEMLQMYARNESLRFPELVSLKTL